MKHLPDEEDTVEDEVEEEQEELDQEIKAQVDEWSANSNECFTVQLVRGDGSVATSFQPEYTYAIFGDQESIFGYQDLSITLSFRAYDLKPKLDVQYGKIFQTVGEIRPTDVKDALREFLPESAFTNEPHTDASDFKPPGERIHEYKRKGKGFEVWCGTLADPAAKELLENMQILVPMFIDGGSTLELGQDWTTRRWKIFLVYEITANADGNSSPYTLAGYGTSYRIFTFPERQKTIQFDDFSPASQPFEHFLPAPNSEVNKLSHPPDLESPLDLPSRERLSQFLMLPPYHGSGHGQELYNVMYKYLTTPDRVREFTIEDPNERFDDLRDFSDLLYLRANVSEFAGLRINTDIPAERLKSTTNIPCDLIVSSGVRKQIMRDTKIMPRQFDRLVEMHTLSFIPSSNRSGRARLVKKEKSPNANDRAYYLWRLYVKQRLYIFNRDQLAQVEHAERVEKLEAALDSVQEAYLDMIAKVEAREKAIAMGEMEDSTSSAHSSFSKRKRPVITDDEDEDDEAGSEQNEIPTFTEANGHKKLRVGR